MRGEPKLSNLNFKLDRSVKLRSYHTQDSQVGVANTGEKQIKDRVRGPSRAKKHQVCEAPTAARKPPGTSGAASESSSSSLFLLRLIFGWRQEHPGVRSTGLLSEYLVGARQHHLDAVQQLPLKVRAVKTCPIFHKST